MRLGQAEKRNTEANDYLAQIGIWWIPPLAHPRRAELLDVLRCCVIGTVTKDPEVVPVIFVQMGTKDEVQQQAGPSNLWTPQAAVAKARAEALAESI